MRRKTIRVIFSLAMFAWVIAAAAAASDRNIAFYAALGYLQIWIVGSFIVQFLDAKE